MSFDPTPVYKIDNIYVITTYMPFPLKECNCFLAEGETGFSIIDCGVNLEINRDIWQRVLKQIGISFKQIKNIYLTHYHHDHMGLAGWLQQLSDAQVHISDTDFTTFKNNIVPLKYASDYHATAFAQTCAEAGWDLGLTLELAQDIANIDPLLHPHPELTLLHPYDHFGFGGEIYSIIPIPGHSDGHYAFYSSTGKTLIAGDNIVDHTILHLTDWPYSNLTNPKTAHLAALNALPAAEIDLTLPGHGLPMKNATAKIQAINAHHEKRQTKVLQALTTQCTAWELAQKVFKSNNYIHIKRLILAETLAYLQALKHAGQVRAELVETKTGIVYEFSRYSR